MQAKYPLKIQAIRSKNQQARLYVYFPLPLAAAIGLEAGEERVLTTSARKTPLRSARFEAEIALLPF